MQYKHDENKESLRKTEDIHGNIRGMEAVLEYIKEGKTYTLKTTEQDEYEFSAELVKNIKNGDYISIATI